MPRAACQSWSSDNHWPTYARCYVFCSTDDGLGNVSAEAGWISYWYIFCLTSNAFHSLSMPRPRHDPTIFSVYYPPPDIPPISRFKIQPQWRISLGRLPNILSTSCLASVVHLPTSVRWFLTSITSSFSWLGLVSGSTRDNRCNRWSGFVLGMSLQPAMTVGKLLPKGQLFRYKGPHIRRDLFSELPRRHD
jgi:hypothetical protein